jgi:hypothetical protein
MSTMMSLLTLVMTNLSILLLHGHNAREPPWALYLFDVHHDELINFGDDLIFKLWA